MVGSAQKRAQRALLQHGSIPLWMDRQRLFQCLQVPPEQRAALVQAAYTTMGAGTEVAAQPVAPAALHAALRQGFGVAFGENWSRCPLLLKNGAWRSIYGPQNTPQTPGTSTAPQPGVSARGVR